MKKLLLLICLSTGVLILNSCSKKDAKNDLPQETPKDISFKAFKLNDDGGVIQLAGGGGKSEIYFFGKFNGEPEENLLVDAITYQSPGGDSLYHFIFDDQYRVKRMHVSFPDGSFDTTIITLSYPDPDTTIVTSYYYDWEQDQSRVHFQAKTYYKNDKLMALSGGRFSLGAFKDVSLKTIIGSVAAAVGVVEVTGAVVALAATAPAWAIVGAGVAIVAFANSAMASEEIAFSEAPYQGPVNPIEFPGEPRLPETTDQQDGGGNWYDNTSGVDSIALYKASIEGLYKVTTDDGSDLYCEIGSWAKYTIYNDSHWPDGYTWKIGWSLREKDGRYYVLTDWTNPGFQIETAQPISYPVTSFVYGNVLYVNVEKMEH